MNEYKLLGTLTIPIFIIKSRRNSFGGTHYIQRQVNDVNIYNSVFSNLSLKIHIEQIISFINHLKFILNKKMKNEKININYKFLSNNSGIVIFFYAKNKESSFIPFHLSIHVAFDNFIIAKKKYNTSGAIHIKTDETFKKEIYLHPVIIFDDIKNKSNIQLIVNYTETDIPSNTQIYILIITNELNVYLEKINIEYNEHIIRNRLYTPPIELEDGEEEEKEAWTEVKRRDGSNKNKTKKINKKNKTKKINKKTKQKLNKLLNYYHK